MLTNSGAQPTARRQLAKGAVAAVGAGAGYVVPVSRRLSVAQAAIGSPPPTGGGGGQLRPDLDPDVISVRPGLAPVGAAVRFSYVVVNFGHIPAVGPWADRVFLVRDPSNLTPLLEVASFTINDPVAPLDSYGRTGTFIVPALEPGDYYLVVWVDREDQVLEYDVSPFDNTLPVLFEVAAAGALGPLAAEVPARTARRGHRALPTLPGPR